MSLSTVALVVPERATLFELGVVHEVFGIDRTDDGVPPFDFRACSERPGEPIAMANGMSLTTSHGLADAADDLVAKLARSAGRERGLLASLPTNRAYLDPLRAGVQQESAA